MCDLEILLVVQGRDLDAGDATVAAGGLATVTEVVVQDVEAVSAEECVADRLVSTCAPIIVVFEKRQEDFDGF